MGEVGERLLSEKGYTRCSGRQDGGAFIPVVRSMCHASALDLQYPE